MYESPKVPSDDEAIHRSSWSFSPMQTKAREVRVKKLERAGLKTYTQVVDSKEGKGHGCA